MRIAAGKGGRSFKPHCRSSGAKYLNYLRTRIAKTSLDQVGGPPDNGALSRIMKVARTLLAVLIAASVAMLPMVGVAVPAATKSMDMSASMAMPASGDMSVSEAMSDCCPPDSAPCDKATGNCADMAACAFSSFSFSIGPFSGLVFPSAGAQILPLLLSQTVHAQTSSPPFRPPRV